jgi:multidrug efflux pump subunit AcrA (membrane-fusion protein)
MLLRLLGNPWVFLGMAAIAFSLGWIAGLRFEKVSTLRAEKALVEQTLNQARLDLEAKQTELDNERENARRAAALASERSRDAALARDRAIEAETKTNDLLAEWTDEAKRAADAARATGLDLARTCPGISAGQWGRLLRDVPIGRAR